MHRPLSRLVFAALLLSAVTGHAQDQPHAPLETETMERPWIFTVVPYVHHWTKSADHRYAFVLSLEKHQDPNWLLGLAPFSNSFGQPSVYAYGAYLWQGVLGEPRLSAKLSAGLLYGYTGRYADKVPFNHNGFSPGMIPSLGYQLNARDGLQLMLLGTAGFALGYSHNF